ncbi:MAG: putative DNA-binding domain-containing protein [Sphingomonas sp.]|nr:putative DNA-binding domain-containing protein [Sphingomonas sp.]
MRLAELQRDFCACLTAEGLASFGPWARTGLAVYQNNYRAQLAACLEESFEKTRQWIGSEAFHEAVVTHVERIPPSNWTLDAYPRDFPETLAMLYPIDPEVAELASLELALAEAFVGPDSAKLTAELIANTNWDHARLIFAPTLEILTLTTNTLAIWTALAEDSLPPMSALLPAEGAMIVWRDGEVPRFRAIDAAELRGILTIKSGTTFADLCAAMVEHAGEAEGVTQAGVWLGEWLKDGMLVDIIE